MLSEEILTYYRNKPEQERFSGGLGVLEFARTKEVIAPLLPNAPGAVYDIGGGTGPYARWLAERGHEVHLLDAAPHHVEMASKIPGLASAVHGDARALPFADDSASAVLLLGPLYHLIEKEDRLQVLQEVKRVLRPGGRIFAAGISRAADALAITQRGWLFDEGLLASLRAQFSSGVHRTPPSRPEFFTTAYFHHPDELTEEVCEADFEVEGLAGLEGPGWIAPDFKEAVMEPDKREKLLELARLLENFPDLSPHILAWGTKRG